MAQILAFLLIVSLASQPALAQITPPPDVPGRGGQVQHLLITGKDTTMHIDGRLIRVDADKLVFRRQNQVFELRRQDVRRVEIIERDTPIDGALVGGAFVAACARWWCGDESTTNAREIVAAGIVGALLWGWIDSRHFTKKLIFKAGDAPSGSARASLAVTIHF